MRVLHDTLPCTANFKRRKRTYRNHVESLSPVRYAPIMKAIASPKIVFKINSTNVSNIGSPI